MYIRRVRTLLFASLALAPISACTDISGDIKAFDKAVTSTASSLKTMYSGVNEYRRVTCFSFNANTRQCPQ